eukprot:1726508-Amphidinium_carterae.1
MNWSSRRLAAEPVMFPRICSQGDMLQPKLYDFDAARIITEDCMPRRPVVVPRKLLRDKQDQSKSHIAVART